MWLKINKMLINLNLVKEIKMEDTEVTIKYNNEVVKIVRGKELTDEEFDQFIEWLGGLDRYCLC